MLSDRRQLLLPFAPRFDFDGRDFIRSQSNAQAISWLHTDWPEGRLAVWGPPGCGKSHLLHMWAQIHHGAVLTGPECEDPAALPASGALALDDADLILPETHLLHVLNTARDRRLCILISSQLPPTRWPVKLPDLSSRLKAMTAVEIRPADDELLALLLAHILAERQLSMSASLQAWLLARVPRSAVVLQEIVARLDRESLREGKAISRSLVDNVLRTVTVLNDYVDGCFASVTDNALL